MKCYYRDAERTDEVLVDGWMHSGDIAEVSADGFISIVDRIKNGEIQLMINTPMGKKSVLDEQAMRMAGLRHGVPCITTMEAGIAAVDAIRSLKAGELKVIKLQEIG